MSSSIDDVESGDEAERRRQLRVVEEPGKVAVYHLSEQRYQPTTALCGEEIIPSPNKRLIDWLYAKKPASADYCEECDEIARSGAA